MFDRFRRRLSVSEATTSPICGQASDAPYRKRAQAVSAIESKEKPCIPATDAAPAPDNPDDTLRQLISCKVKLAEVSLQKEELESEVRLLREHLQETQEELEAFRDRLRHDDTIRAAGGSSVEQHFNVQGHLPPGVEARIQSCAKASISGGAERPSSLRVNLEWRPRADSEWLPSASSHEPGRWVAVPPKRTGQNRHCEALTLPARSPRFWPSLPTPTPRRPKAHPKAFVKSFTEAFSPQSFPPAAGTPTAGKPPLMPRAVSIRGQHALEPADVQLCEGVSIFLTLAPHVRRTMLAYLTVKHYQPGEAIYKCGDVAQMLYILKSGDVVETADGNAHDGDPLPSAMQRLAVGDLFGEREVLDSLRKGAEGSWEQAEDGGCETGTAPRHTTACKAMTTASCLTMSVKCFRETLRNTALLQESTSSVVSFFKEKGDDMELTTLVNAMRGKVESAETRAEYLAVLRGFSLDMQTLPLGEAQHGGGFGTDPDQLRKDLVRETGIFVNGTWWPLGGLETGMEQFQEALYYSLECQGKRVSYVKQRRKSVLLERERSGSDLVTQMSALASTPTPLQRHRRTQSLESVQQLTVDVNNLVTEIPEQTACADVTDQEELARSSMVAVAVERVMFACCRTLSGGDSYLVVNQARLAFSAPFYPHLRPREPHRPAQLEGSTLLARRPHLALQYALGLALSSRLSLALRRNNRFDSFGSGVQLFANAAVTVTPESRLAPPVRISMLSSRLVSVESVDVFKVTHFADDGTDECWCHIYTAVVDEIDFAKGVDGSISDRHMSISYVEAPVTAEELSPRPNPPREGQEREDNIKMALPHDVAASGLQIERGSSI
ncbi:hypothetical protein CYMTET_12513 [Cymbomonas tetramitiformis]|uniref:Cyclic nucleotide-binding domain-containing protein n=1 Tax=Cymbomonas tetramitiformis TaxID=36881 RepID=A0AAE0GK95_9CHLO|nr:hypothetical protein CYMTET_12513 [Cymbomonas tetramitiformis]